MPQLITSRINKRPDSGFTLVEVLISVIVLSIGLLGLAGLQASSLKNNNSAYLRTQAVTLANDIIDRMRANQDIAKAGNYDIDIGTAAATPVAGCTGTGADNCSASDMATLDVSQWKTKLSELLPSGDGSVARTVSGSETMVTVTIQWDDSRGSDGSATTQFPVETVI